LDGHSLSLFITGALIDAISDLVSHPLTDPSELLAELQKKEDVAFENLRNGDLGERTNQIYSPGDDSIPDPSLDLDALWKTPSLCRTGRLPSRTRYLGYSTNSDKVGGPTIVGSEEYETCGEIEKTRSKQGGALLFSCGNDHEVCKEAIVRPDHKDFFYADSKLGWSSLSIPNDKERKAYGYDPSQAKGFLFVTFVICEFGKCPEAELKPKDHAHGKFEMTVNRKVVSDVVYIGGRVYGLKGEDGFQWRPDENGVFVFAVRVRDVGRYIRISSIILY